MLLTGATLEENGATGHQVDTLFKCRGVNPPVNML